jgi:carbonic anhydrase
MTDNNVIDISKNSIKLPEGGYRKCDYKCSYNFSYPETNLVITNNGILLSFSCDVNNNPVTYNSLKYNTTKLFLTCPSLHLFNGVNAAAEIIIEHISELGGKYLYVCVPIVSNGNSSTSGSQYITSIIQQTSLNANIDGATFNYNSNDFTLQDIVPKKPFYSYYGNYINNAADFIVFDVIDAISLEQSTITTLSSIIKPFPITLTGSLIFYNKNGPNNTNIGDGIYISCKPTGASKEKTDVSKPKNSMFTGGASSDNIFSFVYIIMFVLLLCLIFYGIKYLFQLTTTKQGSIHFPRKIN